MELRDVIQYQIDAAANQVDKCLDGLSDDQWDAKLREDLMSPREIVGHLTECYIAALEHLEGKNHDWGSYVPAQDEPAALVAEMRRQRDKARLELSGRGDVDALKAATDYIVMHDAYHVGQLAALRLQVTPDWDPYAIYS